jgi:hypothetical protein
MIPPTPPTPPDRAAASWPPADLEERLRAFLAEDLGSGDVTADAVVPADATASARLVAKAAGVVCGADLVERIVRLLDPGGHRGGRARRRDRRPSRERRGGRARAGARAARGRAHAAQPGAAHVGRRDPHAPLRRRGRGHRCGDLRHAQDGAPACACSTSGPSPRAAA